MRRAAGRQGFAEMKVLTDWEMIVGARLAQLCWPAKLSYSGGAGPALGGTLLLGVEGAAGLEIQHMTPQIMERVNQFYGYRAVSRIRIAQNLAPPPARPKPPGPPRPLTAQEAQGLAAMLAGMEPGPLRDALEDLGACVIRRQDDPPRKD